MRVVLGILLAVFLFHQLYASLYNPITTESASYLSYVDGIPATGVILRNELIIERESSGVMHFCVEDGERVTRNGVIADVYTDEQDSINVAKIASLTEQIDSIRTIQDYNDLAAVDLDLLNSKIGHTLSDLLFCRATGRLNETGEYREQLLTMLNRRELAVGAEQNFATQLASLQSQRDALENSLRQPVSSITTPNSGFFVSSTDGYETRLTTDDLSCYTPEFLESVEPTPAQNCVGKIVSDYTWYVAAVISADDAVKFRPNDAVRLHTSLRSNPNLQVTVAAVNRSPSSDRAVVVFSCQEMNKELATMRKLPITIVDGEYEGLKVNRSALRFVDGSQGVFVISGMELKFVKVTVLFSKEDADYVICEKAAATDKTALRLYDKVVTKGKNLYDGKIIN